MRAAAPLVRELAERYPEHQLLITTMTPTGSAQVHELFSGKAVHCYAPYDYPSAVRRFLDRTRPAIAIVMETELWPNIFHACRERAIPVFVANVRMSDSSMHKYLRFARLPRPVKAREDLNELLGGLLDFVAPEMAAAGVDESNTAPGTVVLLPADPRGGEGVARQRRFVKAAVAQLLGVEAETVGATGRGVS